MTSKNSVFDQPGLALSLIGLFIALFVGLSIRALIKPEKVREHLVRATSAIHKDFKFEFRDAHVSLADGILPDLSVVIEEIAIQSDKTCWLSPLAEINEIRLPLSWSELFQGKVHIREVLADEVNMSLRQSFKACEEGREPAQAVVTSAGATEVIQESMRSVASDSNVDSIRISSLKIHYLPIAFTSFEIQSLKIRSSSENPRIVDAEGKLNLGGETMVGDYSSHADLALHWQDGDQANFNALVKGLWREGHYDLSLNVEPVLKKFSLQTDIRHLPLSQVIPVLKKYRWMESEFNGKQAWFSGKLKMTGETTKLQQTPIELSELKLEGNLGEISCQQVTIASLEPLKYPDVDLQIRGLNLQEFLIFLGRGHPSPALGSLGIFNGVSHIKGPDSVHLSGDFSGLEFIFANRGSRQIQTLSLLSGELDFKNNRWQVFIDRIKPHQGIFEGKVSISADRDFRQMQLDMKVDEMTLSPDVQALMTNGGSIGTLSGQLQAGIHSGEIDTLKGQVKIDQMLVDGILFKAPKAAISTKDKKFAAQISAQQIDFEFANPTMRTNFTPVLENLKSANSSKLELKNFSTEIQTLKLAQFSWKNLMAGSAQGQLRSSGAWDEKGKLTGDLSFSAGSKVSGKWELTGFRSAPVWTRREGQ